MIEELQELQPDADCPRALFPLPSFLDLHQPQTSFWETSSTDMLYPLHPRVRLPNWYSMGVWQRPGLPHLVTLLFCSFKLSPCIKATKSGQSVKSGPYCPGNKRVLATLLLYTSAWHTNEASKIFLFLLSCIYRMQLWTVWWFISMRVVKYKMQALLSSTQRKYTVKTVRIIHIVASCKRIPLKRHVETCFGELVVVHPWICDSHLLVFKKCSAAAGNLIFAAILSHSSPRCRELKVYYRVPAHTDTGCGYNRHYWFGYCS